MSLVMYSMLAQPIGLPDAAARVRAVGEQDRVARVRGVHERLEVVAGRRVDDREPARVVVGRVVVRAAEAMAEACEAAAKVAMAERVEVGATVHRKLNDSTLPSPNGRLHRGMLRAPRSAEDRERGCSPPCCNDATSTVFVVDDHAA